MPKVELPPEMPLTSQVMGVPGATHIDAMKTWVVPRLTFAVPGEREFAAAQEIVTAAEADFEGSATLIASTVTTSGEDGIAGAVYVAESAPVEAIVPSVEFPPGTLLTFQLTAGFATEVPVTVAVKLAEPPGARLAEFGERETTMSLWICTVAEPDAEGTDWLVAVTETLEGLGGDAGAV